MLGVFASVQGSHEVCQVKHDLLARAKGIFAAQLLRSALGDRADAALSKHLHTVNAP